MLKKIPWNSLYLQVIVAIALGVWLGNYHPEAGAAMKPFGDAFIKLIKMLIAPLIFCSVIVGIAGAENMKKVGRVGGLALLYFEVVSSLALVIGLIAVNVFQPGADMHVDVAALDASAIAAYAAPAQAHSTTQFLLDVIPHTLVGAFVEGAMLQVLLLAILFGFALQRLGGRESPVFLLIERFNQLLFQIIGMIMRLAPIGAFGAMAFTIGSYGVGSLLSLAKLMGTFYATCVIFVFVGLGLIARAHGFSVWKFVKYIREELLIVLGTSSSEAVLPRMLAKLERLGASKPVVGLVIPTGYSFNLDGTSIYLTMAAIFVAQATGTPLSLTQQIGVLAVLLLASKGAAGVTGSGFIVLAATLSTVGHVPVAGLTLILGIDRFMSEARALTNLIGNGVATLVVAKWTGELDGQTLQRELAHPTPLLAAAPETSLAGRPADRPYPERGARPGAMPDVDALSAPVLPAPTHGSAGEGDRAGSGPGERTGYR